MVVANGVEYICSDHTKVFSLSLEDFRWSHNTISMVLIVASMTDINIRKFEPALKCIEMNFSITNDFGLLINFLKIEEDK